MTNLIIKFYFLILIRRNWGKTFGHDTATPSSELELTLLLRYKKLSARRLNMNISLRGPFRERCNEVGVRAEYPDPTAGRSAREDVRGAVFCPPDTGRGGSQCGVLQLSLSRDSSCQQ